MGYTHYWTPAPFLEGDWARFHDRLKKLLRASPCKLAKEYDEPKERPVLDETHVQFNGIGEDGHETFWIDRDGSQWQFCKTARKPYDTVVTAALCYLDAIQGFQVTSDGDQEDWQEGLALARKVWPDLDLTLPEEVK